MADRKVTTRRTALIGLSALGVNGFVAPAAVGPSDAMQRAYSAFLRAWEQEGAFYHSIDLEIADEAEDQRLSAFIRATLDAGAAVSALPGRTMEDLRCKAHVALYYHGNMACLERDEESGALASIARDLLAMV